ncbi:hypothetical protein AMATHDRAFT_8981 [Amanita thiersii Skay4041]|uniref:Uncharacterized protein n=1 Tax=Amanita thiersii Skay4041 TaxID=703135 RepID=A0A2A9NCX6_9AGAR|nr:hypothetical protein AMATHDRAFT_8981 [Amanita thiersii Skay4041]
MEIDCCESIIALITELNENAAKAIKDIRQKPNHTANKDKINLIIKQGWEMAKRAVIQNPSKFSPPNISPSQYPKIILDIANSLRETEDNSWALKIMKDIKNKGLQSKAMEHRIQGIVRRLNNLETTIPLASKPTLPQLPSHTQSMAPIDHNMPPADPIPWTDMEEYKQNCQLWINSASEIFEKMAPYFLEEE